MTITHISTFPPTRCGIAYYAESLIQNLVKASSDTHIKYNINASNNYEIAEDLKNVKLRLASSDVVHVHHEFGIYPGSYGDEVVKLYDVIDLPILTTLHSVPYSSHLKKDSILKYICDSSDVVAVFSAYSKSILKTKLDLRGSKISVIPHGVTISQDEHLNTKNKNDDTLEFFSIGLLKPDKGYEFVIKAFALYKRYNENFRYYIIGVNHPEKPQSNSYRKSLEELIKKLNLEDHIQLINKFYSNEELQDKINRYDVGILPYINMERSSSGILTQLAASSKAVITTPFAYSKIFDDQSVLFTTLDTNQLYKNLVTMSDKIVRERFGKKAKAKVLSFDWSFVCDKYLSEFRNIATLTNH